MTSPSSKSSKSSKSPKSSGVRMSGAAAKIAMETERIALREQYSGWTAEQIGLVNLANLQVAAKFARAGRAVFKRWVSLEDNRVRPAHAEADGQFQVLESPFQVGGEKCMYPQDPSLSPQLRINCRCLLIFEDEDGRDLKSYRTLPAAQKRIHKVLDQIQF